MVANGNKSNEKGKNAELKAKITLEQSFLKDFVFLNPKFKTGGNEKELADIVIVYFDILVIIQCKSKKITKSVENYIRKAVKDACYQLKSSYNRLTKKNIQITFENNRRGKIEWDKTPIKTIYSIIILEQEYPIANYNLLVNLFPEIKEFKFTPQIFDLADLEKLIYYLDTPSDFFDYLNERQKIVTNIAYVMHNESDLFGYYLLSERKLDTFKENPKLATLILDEGFSESLFNGKLAKQLKDKQKLDKKSFIIDYILDKMYTTFSKEYLRYMEDLVKLNRFQRRIIGKNVLDKSSQAVQRPQKYGWFMGKHPDPSKSIGFAFLIHDFPREFGRNFLVAISQACKYKMKLNKVLGVAMPLGYNYFDFCIDDQNYEYPDSNMEKLVKELWIRDPIIKFVEEFPQ